MRKRAYISLYQKNGIEKLAKVLEDQGWEIYSSLSTHRYLVGKDINSIEIKTDIHPNLAVISSFSQIKNIYSLPKMTLIIADIPKDLDDEVYNLTLIVAALRKKIPVITSDFDRFIQQIRIFGDLTKESIYEIENETLHLVSYILSNSAYIRYPYINEKLSYLNIPLLKLKELKYGENPHQKASLYLTPFKADDFELIYGDLTTNHFFDIKKALEIMNELDIPFTMILNHSNISYFSWADTTPTTSGHCAVINNKLTRNLAQNLMDLGIKMFIVREIEEEALRFFKRSLNNNEIIILKVPYHIRPPQEYEILHFERHLVIQEKNSQSLNLKVLTSKKPNTEMSEKIKVGLVIAKHLKTFSAAIVRNKELKGFSQGEPTIKDALKKVFYQTTELEKSTIFSERFDRSTLILNGPLISEIAQILINHPIDAVVSTYADEESLKILEEKNIILVVSEKRYYNHI